MSAPAQRERAAVPFGTFADAMSRLVSGVAVVTAAHPGGKPAGLLVSSICSYSADPPSVLVVVGTERASYPALTAGGPFGVHLLGASHRPLATVFASSRSDKFADLAWEWHAEVPRLPDIPVFLRCVPEAVFRHGDHAVLIGRVVELAAQPGEPLIYYRRELTWHLC